MEKRSKLGITIAQIKEIDNGSNSDSSLVHDMKTNLLTEQRPMIPYIYSVANEFGIHNESNYFYSVMSTYEMIRRSKGEYCVEEIPQNTCDLALYNLLDYASDRNDRGRFDWFLDKIESDSPDFREYIFHATRIFAENDANDFLLGVVAVALPIYMHYEAQEMEQRFFSDK